MTIYDIAKEAGVSASTVSRVINNRPGIKAQTRERVQKLLREHNYSPNAAARGLVNQASRTVGILVSDIRTLHHTEGAYLIIRELAQYGYCCILFNTGPEDHAKTEYIQLLASRRVEGVVMMGSAFQEESVRQAIETHLSGLPVVIANGYLDMPNVYGVMADECNGIRGCVELLLAKGRRHPAFVIDAYTPSNELKLEGFVEAVRGAGLGEPVIWESQGNLQGGYDATRQLLEQHPDTDGIVYTVDLLAAGGLHALRDRGVRVPEQVAVIGVDNSVYSEISCPKLTSLDNKLLEMSTTVSNILIGALQKKKQPQKIMLYSTLVERETT